MESIGVTPIMNILNVSSFRLMKPIDIIDFAARMIGYVFLSAFLILTVWKFAAMIKVIAQNLRKDKKRSE